MPESGEFLLIRLIKLIYVRLMYIKCISAEALFIALLKRYIYLAHEHRQNLRMNYISTVSAMNIASPAAENRLLE